MLTRGTWLRERCSYANVVATMALFIALGGGAYAAVKVTGKNVVDSSLTGRDIKNESLGSSDIKGLKATDFAAGQLLAGKNGANGANGAPGVKGDPGAAGANGTNGTNGTNGATGPAGPAGPGASAHGPDTGQFMTSGTIEAADLSVQDWDSGTMYTPPNNEIVIAVAGKYLVSGVTDWGANATGTRVFGIVLGPAGSPLDLGNPVARAKHAAVSSDSQTVTAILNLAAGDLVGLLAFQDSGSSTLQLRRPRLAVQWLAP